MIGLSRQAEKKATLSVSGFTLIEAVVAIVVTSILAIGIVSYIGDTVTAIDNAANRSRLASSGRVAIQRLSVELHNALPNSVRVTPAAAGGDQCIEFIPVRTATTYINPSFGGSGSTSFQVVDFQPDQEGVSGGYAVIYPRRQDLLYDGDEGGAASKTASSTVSSWPTFPNRRPIQEISNIALGPSANQSTVNLVTSHSFRRRSPNQRFFVVDQPISYCVVGDKLYRYTDYGFYTSQVTEEEEPGTCERTATDSDRCLPDYDAGPARKKALITENIDNAGFRAFTVSAQDNAGFITVPSPQNLTRNSLISIVLNMSADGDSIQLNHDVLARSVP